MEKFVDGKHMVEHHTHYKEIHGYDKTVWMEVGKHHALHCRLRKNGECGVSVSKLNQIANRAHYRTRKGKEYKRQYTVDFVRKYSENIAVDHNINLRMVVTHNTRVDSVKVHSSFQGNHGRKIHRHSC